LDLLTDQCSKGHAHGFRVPGRYSSAFLVLDSLFKLPPHFFGGYI
jgi:hypothetical protein